MAKKVQEIGYTIKSYLKRVIIAYRQKSYLGRLHYILDDRGSNTLLIIFSAFGGDRPMYNYMNALRGVNADKLFILDDFGYKGSYYWFERGKDTPKQLVLGLIHNVLTHKQLTGGGMQVCAR